MSFIFPTASFLSMVLPYGDSSCGSDVCHDQIMTNDSYEANDAIVISSSFRLIDTRPFAGHVYSNEC